jgi:chloramphenicol O-acetyltransferase
MDNMGIYAKQTGAVVQYIELPYFNDTAIMIAKKLRFQKVDEIPRIKKGIQAINEVGISDLMEPLKVKINKLLADPAWVMVLLDAVHQEINSPTLTKM